MKIDNTPAIRAFCEARIDQLRLFNSLDNAARIDELEMIITLCDGLTAQAELLKSVLPNR